MRLKFTVQVAKVLETSVRLKQARSLPGLLLLGLLAANPDGLLIAQDVYEGTFDSRVATINASPGCTPASSSTVTLTAGTTSVEPEAAKLTACPWGSLTGATFTFEAPSAPLTGVFSGGNSVSANFRSTTTAAASASVTYAGANLRAERRVGLARSNVTNKSALVRGGECEDQGKGFQFDSKSFTQQPGTAALNATATCLVGGLTVDQASIRREGSRIVEFKAYHENSGGFTLSIGEDVAQGPAISWGIFVRTTYLFQPGTTTAPDAVQFSNVTPPPEQPLAADSDQRFAGRVTYTLGSKDNASLQLELTDSSGKVRLAASEARQISSRSSSSVDLAIATAHLPGAPGTVILHAALRDSGGTLLKEDTRVFVVAAATGADRISFLNKQDYGPRVIPRAATPIQWGGPIPIAAEVGFDLETKPQGAIALALTDNTGTVWALSQRGAVSKKGAPGDIQEFYWGIELSDYVQMPADIPANVTKFLLTAVLLDSAGNPLTKSASVEYPIAKPPVVKLQIGTGEGASFTETDPSRVQLLSNTPPYPTDDNSTPFSTYRIVYTSTDPNERADISLLMAYSDANGLPGLTEEWIVALGVQPDQVIRSGIADRSLSFTPPEALQTQLYAIARLEPASNADK